MLAKVYYTSKLWYYGTLIYYGKLWYYGKNYGTVDKTMILYWDFRTSIYEQKKNHGRLPNTKKLWFIMEKDMEIYQNNWCFEQTYSFRTVIYYGKTMVLWKKLWYYGKNHGTLIYYGKNYGTMEKTMVL